MESRAAVQQLLWIETLLKLTGGLVLMLLPLTTIRVLGLQRTDGGFWPRLLGAVLLGLAAASYVEGATPGSRGLGLAGSVLINLSGAGMLIVLLALDRASPSSRGRLLLWIVAVLLVALSFVEIAHM